MYANKRIKKEYFILVIFIVAGISSLLIANYYSQQESPLDWAEGAVWYQVFPERFFNGDLSNDPSKDYVMSEHPGFESSNWSVSNWTSEWYKLTPEELSTGEDFDYVAVRRRYGGDIQGIIDKLDYIKGLGVDAIYLNPIFQAPSLHKYDEMYYHHVDPYLGPDPEGDIALIKSEVPENSSTWVWTKADLLALKLVEEVHKRDMKIIFDGVFNHVGIHNFAFEDVVKNGESSKYADWFDIYDWNKSNSLGIPFTYKGWADIPYLPEWKEDAFGIVNGPREYIFDSVHRWMDPNMDGNPSDGVDGWRLDVAFSVNHNFWKKFRVFVKDINPSSYLVGEVWGNPGEVVDYLKGDEFDAVMNYNFAFYVYDFFVNDALGISASEFVSGLESLVDVFPKQSFLLQQNLIDSHDTQRFMSGLINKDIGVLRKNDEFFWQSKVMSNPSYNVSGPSAFDVDRFKVAVAFQLLFPGAPMIYYGDEAGMWGANDPDSRKPMVWEEFNYSSEKTLPNQSAIPESKVYFRNDLHDFYKSILSIRNNNSALKNGNVSFVFINDSSNSFAFKREYGKNVALVLINYGSNESKFLIENLTSKNFKNLLYGESYDLKNGILEIRVPSYSFLVLAND